MSPEWSIKNFDKIFDREKPIEVKPSVEVKPSIKIPRTKPIRSPEDFGETKKSNDELIIEIKELYLKGWSFVKIGEKLKISRSAVSGIVFREKATKRKNRSEI